MGLTAQSIVGILEILLSFLDFLGFYKLPDLGNLLFLDTEKAIEGGLRPHPAPPLLVQPFSGFAEHLDIQCELGLGLLRPMEGDRGSLAAGALRSGPAFPLLLSGSTPPSPFYWDI